MSAGDPSRPIGVIEAGMAAHKPRLPASHDVPVNFRKREMAARLRFVSYRTLPDRAVVVHAQHGDRSVRIELDAREAQQLAAGIARWLGEGPA